tara:strand:- start:1612 stop:2901 length:1290 start_codon:yes stop_codon:yes gene_type:complete
MRSIYYLSLFCIAFANDYLPQQIHISYTNIPTEMMITWTTIQNPVFATVRYSSANKSYSTTSLDIREFMDDGELHRLIFINRVLIKNVVQDEKYTYTCGSEKYGWSTTYTFYAMRNISKKEPLRFLFYGDFGDENSVSLRSIQDKVNTERIDAILHIGDFAYDLADNNGLVGDAFMTDIESIASQVPYMTTVGNHEYHYNFSHYRNRFTMPNHQNTENMLYSWNIGTIHFISFSTEVYFEPYTHITSKNISNIKKQFEWLVSDLTKNKNASWIITIGHRPMYCSRPDNDACTWTKNPVRDGILYKNKMIYGLEQLFYDFSVDIELWGHEHNYERLYPVYKNIPYKENITIINSTTYYNCPITPIHIISGAAGNKEMNGNPVLFTNNSWSAFTNDNYGYGYMEIYNDTHLHIQQFNGITNHIIDDVWVIK